MAYYDELLDRCEPCEICGISGALDSAYPEPYYTFDGKLINRYPEKYRGGRGGHYERRVHFEGGYYGYRTIGLTLCCYCHSYVCDQRSRKSVATSHEHYQKKMLNYFLYRAWARINQEESLDKLYTRDTKASGIMLFSHSNYPFVRGLVLAVPYSDVLDVEDDLRLKSKFKYVIVDKVYKSEKIPEWAISDTELKNTPENQRDANYTPFFSKKDNQRDMSFNVYVEVSPYQITEEKKEAARYILSWLRQFALPRVMARFK